MGVNVRSDLQEENRKHKPYDAWYKHLPWIQNPKKLVAYGIGMFVFAGKFALILPDFISDFHVFTLDSRNCCSFGPWNL